MSMRRLLWGAGVLAVIGMGAGCAHDEAKQAHSQGEKVGEAFSQKTRFADQLSLFNQKQISLAQLALEKSTNPEVRTFAQDLIHDHQKSQDDLETLADSKTMALATVNLSTEDLAVGGAGLEGTSQGVEKGKDKYDKKFDEQVTAFRELRDSMTGLSGHEFDKAFLGQVKEAQQDAEKLIDKGLKNYSDDTSLALFLSRTSPVVDSHQQRAEVLKGLIGG